MGLLKFLLVTIAVLWLVRMVARLIFPWAMRKMAEKVMGNAQQQYYRNENPHRPHTRRQTKTDGKVHIDYVPPQSPKNGGRNAGEFVDFEEIKSSAE